MPHSASGLAFPQFPGGAPYNDRLYTMWDVVSRYVRETGLGIEGTVAAASIETITDPIRLASAQYSEDEFARAWVMVLPSNVYGPGVSSGYSVNDDIGLSSESLALRYFVGDYVRPVTSYDPSSGVIKVFPAFAAIPPEGARYIVIKFPHPEELFRIVNEVLSEEVFSTALVVPSVYPVGDFEALARTASMRMAPFYDAGNVGVDSLPFIFTTYSPGTIVKFTERFGPFDAGSTSDMGYAINGRRAVLVCNDGMPTGPYDVDIGITRTSSLEPGKRYHLYVAVRNIVNPPASYELILSRTNAPYDEFAKVSTAEAFGEGAIPACMLGLSFTPSDEDNTVGIDISLKIRGFQQYGRVLIDDVILVGESDTSLPLPPYVSHPSQVMGVYRLEFPAYFREKNKGVFGISPKLTPVKHFQPFLHYGGYPVSLELRGRATTGIGDGTLIGAIVARSEPPFESVLLDTRSFSMKHVASLVCYKAFQMLVNSPAAATVNIDWAERRMREWQQAVRLEDYTNAVRKKFVDNTPPMLTEVRSTRWQY